MGFLFNDRNQMNLLGFSINEFVPEDAKARFVVDLVLRLDLSELYARYSSQGADAFDPETMLATWFFGYCEGQISTRKLEEACKRDTHFIYVSANLHPDHTSLSRFRKENLDLISEYFVQLVQWAVEQEVSDFHQISIDGSKVQASCSRKQSTSYDTLEKKLSSIRNRIDTYMSRCDLAEANEMEEGDLEQIREKIAELQQVEQKLEGCQEQLEQRKEQIKPEYRGDHTINITEPDAYLMSGVNRDQSRPAYNVQLGVDAQTHLIVSGDVVQDRNDSNQFMRQHDHVEQILGIDAGRCYAADSGYHSLEQLEDMYDRRIDAVINDPHPEHRATNFSPVTSEELLDEGRRVEKRDFRFDAEGNYYHCPAGKKLGVYRTSRKRTNPYIVYRGKACHACLLQPQCIDLKRNRSGYRHIRRDVREHYAEQMSQKLMSDHARERLKIRATTVEPVIGNLKENLGFRRFRLRGLYAVNGEFNYMCIGHNINVLYKTFGQRTKDAIAAVQKDLSSSLDLIKSFCRGLFEGNIFLQQPVSQE